MTIISGVSVFDEDSPNLTVELEALHGKLSVPPSSIVTGNNTAVVRLVGPQAEVNAALASLDYQFNVGYIGNDRIAITAFDGSLSDEKTIDVFSIEAGALSGTVAFGFTATANLIVNEGWSGAASFAFSVSGNLTVPGAGDWVDDDGTETSWTDDASETEWVDD